MSAFKYSISKEKLCGYCKYGISYRETSQMAMDRGLVELAQDAVKTETVSYERKTGSQKNTNHPGRNHFPQKTRIIETEVDTTNMVKIEEEITEILQLREAKFYVHREVRPK